MPTDEKNYSRLLEKLKDAIDEELCSVCSGVGSVPMQGMSDPAVVQRAERITCGNCFGTGKKRERS